MKKTRNNIEWEFDPTTNKFFNHFTNKWVSNPRVPAKGKAKGKAITKSKKKITITLEEETIKLINSNYEFIRGARYCEKVLFFLYHVKLIGSRNEGLRNKAIARDNKVESFFHRETGEERGVYISSDDMKILFGGNYSIICDELVELGLLDIQGEQYQNTNTKEIKHYVYTVASSNKQSFEITSKLSVEKVEKFRTSAIRSNDELMKLFKLTSKFTSTDSELSERLKDATCYSIDNYGGRFHTPLTNIKAELRYSLRLNGNYVAEVDIRNCQPLMLFAFLINHEEMCKHLNEDIKITLSKEERKELDAMYKAASNGLFYELFVDSGINFDVDPDTLKFEDRRDKSKQFFMKLSMGQNKAVNEETAKYFPAFVEYLNQLKSVGIKNTQLKKGQNQPYKRSSFIMQRTEVYYMNKIRKALGKNGICYTTIHDSFMVEEHNKGSVAAIISGELYKLVATTSIKSYGPK
tara:strand:- start:1453 stop:2847 length:1395 start_codon:yes stop_codon:yes gene_type:complete